MYNNVCKILELDREWVALIGLKKEEGVGGIFICLEAEMDLFS